MPFLKNLGDFINTLFHGTYTVMRKGGKCYREPRNYKFGKPVSIDKASITSFEDFSSFVGSDCANVRVRASIEISPVNGWDDLDIRRIWDEKITTDKFPAYSLYRKGTKTVYESGINIVEIELSP